MHGIVKREKQNTINSAYGPHFFTLWMRETFVLRPFFENRKTAAIISENFKNRSICAIFSAYNIPIQGVSNAKNLKFHHGNAHRRVPSSHRRMR